jgi:hypothetical protein
MGQIRRLPGVRRLTTDTHVRDLRKCSAVGSERRAGRRKLTCQQHVRQQIGGLRARQRSRAILGHRGTGAIEQIGERRAIPVGGKQWPDQSRCLAPKQRGAVTSRTLRHVQAFAAQGLLLGIHAVPHRPGGITLACRHSPAQDDERDQPESHRDASASTCCAVTKRGSMSTGTSFKRSSTACTGGRTTPSVEMSWPAAA